MKGQHKSMQNFSAKEAGREETANEREFKKSPGEFRQPDADNGRQIWMDTGY